MPSRAHPQGRLHDVPQENPLDQLTAMMLEVKLSILGGNGTLSEDDLKDAEEMINLEGIDQLQAYEKWRFNVEDSEVVSSLRSELQEVVSQRDTLKEEKEVYKRMATVDKLTEAYTRHFFDPYLEQQMNIVDSARSAPRHRRQSEEKEGFSLLMLDIDHFKQINDTLGHDGGDEILRSLVDLLKNHLRDEDLVARTGGEEFLIFLRTDKENAERIANVLRQLVETKISQAWKLKADQGTVSMGVTTYDMDNPQMKPAQLIKQADEALYHSKNTGRNRVTVYDPNIITGKDKQEAKIAALETILESTFNQS